MNTRESKNELLTPSPIATVFLDRDGVINRRPGLGYVTTVEGFDFLPGVRQAIARMSQAGLRLFVVTNQRGIGHGLMSHDDLTAIHGFMRSELHACGAELSAIYYCPHHPGECECKKPKPGMFLQAKKEFPATDFATSVVIGDSMRDIQAGWAVGCLGILVGPEDDRRQITEKLDQQHIPLLGQADSLKEAVERFVMPYAVGTRKAAC